MTTDGQRKLITLIKRRGIRRHYIAAFLLAALLFACDLLLPLGIAGGVPYVVLILLGFMSRSVRAVLLWMGLGIFLTLCGLLLSPDPVAPWSVVIVNRVLSVFAIGVTGIMAYFYLTLADEVRRDSEVRLQSIASHLPGYIFRGVRTAEGRFHYDYLSGSVRRLFGLEPQALVADSSLWYCHLPPEDREVFAEALERSAQELSPLDTEYRIQLAHGHPRWIRTLAHPYLRHSGEIYWDGIGLDVTVPKAYRGSALLFRLL